MTETQREALARTLDFPPKGSVAYKTLEHDDSDESGEAGKKKA